MGLRMGLGPGLALVLALGLGLGELCHSHSLAPAPPTPASAKPTPVLNCRISRITSPSPNSCTRNQSPTPTHLLHPRFSPNPSCSPSPWMREVTSSPPPRVQRTILSSKNVVLKLDVREMCPSTTRPLLPTTEQAVSVPKIPKPDQAATSACAKNKEEGPKPGEHIKLFRMEQDRNKGVYFEKR